MRTCAGCKKKGENEDFIRFVEFEGKLIPDLTRKLPGRGYNICPTRNCIREFLKRRFRKRFSEEEVYSKTVESLKNYLLHLLSLSHKTGVTVIGQDAVLELPRKEGVLFLSKDLSDKTKKRLMKKASLVIDNIFSSEELGNALRKERRAGVVFVEKAGLGRKLFYNAKKLKHLIEGD